MNKKLPHILMVNLSKSWGGGEKWFLTVGKGLRERKWQVEWLCYPQSALEERLRKEKLPYKALKLRVLNLVNPLLTLSLYNYLQRSRPDFLFLNASHELKTAGWVGKWAGIPHIVFRRGVSYPLSDSAFNHYLMKQVVTAFLGNAKATYEAFLARFSELKEKPTLYLNNAINLREEAISERDPAGQNIGLVARLAKEKGIDRAIQAMKILSEEMPQAKLHIWGEGPEKESLLALIHDLGLEDQVFLRGFADHVMKELSQCRAFVFPSRYGEGTSLALIEAMALGLPCVVFDTPAMSEVVVDQETGFVVAEGDIRGFAKAMGLLIQNPNLARKLGQGGRVRAEAHFSMESLLDRLEEWLLSLGESPA